jgi:glutamate-1-semialdehyde 2,1-aminomutase
METIRELCTSYNITFILDEVIRGFRLSLGGAQQFFNILPELSIFAKALASGYPISLITGKREWMWLIENAKVIHADTMNSGNATVAAALTTIVVLEKELPYDSMFSLGKELMQGIRDAAIETGHKLLVQGPGPMLIFHLPM